MESFNKAIDINPENHEVWYLKGLVLRDLGNIDESVKSFERVLELDSEGLAALLQLAINYRNMKELKKSIDCFDQILKINPKTLWCLWKRKDLGVLCFHQGAFQCFEKL